MERQGVSMGSFGQDLKKARESKGVALEAIAAATKITTRYLQAVEREEFDQLPGGVFRRSIVRSYARFAGLDEDAWVKRYLEISQPEETPISEEDRAWAEFAENVGRSRARSADGGNHNTVRWAGVVALLLLVIGMGWFVWGYVHNRAAAAVKGSGASSALTARTASASRS
jgi:cytoskeleton protein RodZ